MAENEGEGSNSGDTNQLPKWIKRERGGLLAVIIVLLGWWLLSSRGPFFSLLIGTVGAILLLFVFTEMPPYEDQSPFCDEQMITAELDRQIEHRNHVTQLAVRTIQFNTTALIIVATILTFGVRQGKLNLSKLLSPVIVAGTLYLIISLLLTMVSVTISSIESPRVNSAGRLLDHHYKRNEWNAWMVPLSLFTGFYGSVVLIGNLIHRAGIGPVRIFDKTLYEIGLLVFPILLVGLLLVGRQELLESQTPEFE